MTKTAWIGSLAAAMCVGFLIGAVIAKGKKAQVDSGGPTAEREAGKRESEHIRAYVRSLERLRLALIDKEKEVGDMRAELADLEAKAPLPIGSEEEDRRARSERTKELRTKILQRKDRALRAQGLEELAALLESQDPDQSLLGFAVLRGIFPQTVFDKERFKPYVVAALSHQDAEIRQAALFCLHFVYPEEDHLHLPLSMVDDPSPGVRAQVALSIVWGSGSVGRPLSGERREEAITVLRALLQDEDKKVRGQALHALDDIPGAREEMEDLALELLNDPEKREDMLRLLARRDSIGEKVAHRLVEIYDEGEGGYYEVGWTRGPLSDDAKPIAVDLCLRVIRDSIVGWQRETALGSLRRIGDASVLPELQEIADSPDAEGIEFDLGLTIEHLQEQANQPR